MAPKKHTGIEPMDFLGLNKGSHDASLCWIREENGQSQVQIFLKERMTRRKHDGGSIVPMAQQLRSSFDFIKKIPAMAETTIGERPSDASKPNDDQQANYIELIKSGGLECLLARYNPRLSFLPHHFAHAIGSAALSPFEKSLILVSDGMGSYADAFDPKDPEIVQFPPPTPGLARNQLAETISVYLQNGLSLQCVAKTWVEIPTEVPELHIASEGLGLFYSTCTNYVFGHGLEAGKLMGLAPFGKPDPVKSRAEYVQSFPKKLRRLTKSKKSWGNQPQLKLFQNIAASAQAHFEQEIQKLVHHLKARFPEVENLVLTGGTALNCVANTKIAKLGLFRKIYVPPFPSDEGISFGLATWVQYRDRLHQWQPKPSDSPLEFWGPMTSVPSDQDVLNCFSGYRFERPKNLVSTVAQMLNNGAILAWFQGRSECGPRALGHRSILADPSIPGLQKFLNQKVKFREEFRPYGASCLLEDVHQYFDFPDGIESPSMSFTAQIRPAWEKRLSAVKHIDGSSRIQTLSRSQDPLFYDLLKSFGQLSGYSVLLNTSLNGAGEPIIETIEQATIFFETAPIHGIVFGPFVIHKR